MNRTDWEDSGAIFKDKDGTDIKKDYVVPFSCCSDLEGSDYNTCETTIGMSNLPEGSFTQGCWQKFHDDVIKANQNYILYSGITIIIIMVRISLNSNFIECIFLIRFSDFCSMFD